MPHISASLTTPKRTQPFAPPPPPPPPPSGGMVWGAATRPLPGTSESAQGAFNNHERDVGRMGIYRTYHSSPESPWPATWSQGGADLWGSWQTRWSWVSFKINMTRMATGGFDASLRAYVNSIPVTGYRRLLTAYHEPENDNLDWGLYKRAIYRFHSVVKDVNHPDVLTGPCFMSRFNLTIDTQIVNSDSTDLASVIDFVGFDPYNEAAMELNWPADKQGSQGAAFYYGPLRTWVNNNLGGASMPLAFGEIGYTNDFLGSVKRPNWLYATEAWCNTNNVIAVCYYDSYVRRSPFIRAHTLERPPWPSAPYPADPGSMAALADLYNQYPAYAG